MNIADMAAALARAQGAGSRFDEALIVPAILRATRPKHASNQNDKRSPLQRFMAKVAFGASDCWYWWGNVDAIGYGRTTHANENKAHRVSWLLYRGPIPNGMRVLHKCDVRNCVNPDHLFLGTQRDNVRDMIAKGRGVSKPRYGEANPMSRLTAAQAAAIRQEYAAGGVSMAALGRRYGVAQMTVCRVVRGETWTK